MLFQFCFRYSLKENAIPIRSFNSQIHETLCSIVDTSIDGDICTETTGNTTEESYEEVEYLDESFHSIYEDVEYLDDAEENSALVQDCDYNGVFSFSESFAEPENHMCTNLLVNDELVVPLDPIYMEMEAKVNGENFMPCVGLNDDRAATFDSVFTVDYKSLFETEKEKNAKLHESMEGLKQDLRKSNRKSAWRLKSNKTFKRKNQELKRKFKLLQYRKTDDSKLANLVRRNPVLHNSLVNSSRKPKGRRYNNHSRKFALGAYLAGPAAYRFVRSSNIIQLPSKMTINRWNSNIYMKPGLNTEILNRLKSRTENFTKKEKAVTICIDGMSIRPELTYNAKKDTFVGFPDNGKIKKYENNNPLVLATEAVVLMVSGITTLTMDHPDGCKSKSRNKRFKQVTQILATVENR